MMNHLKESSKNPEGYVGKKNDHGYGIKPRKEFENKDSFIKSILKHNPRNLFSQQQVHPTRNQSILMEC